jgi:hypothetical protein
MARYLEGRGCPPKTSRMRSGRCHARRAVSRRLRRASKNLGTTALLDLLVEGVPSPAKKGTTIEFGDARAGRLHLQDDLRSVRGTRISCYRVLAGPITGDTTLVDRDTRERRLGQLLLLNGKDNGPADQLSVRRSRRGGEAEGRRHGRRARRSQVPWRPPHIGFPSR